MIPTLSPATAGGGLPLPAFINLASRHGFSGIEFSIAEAATLVEQEGFAAVAALFEEHTLLPIISGLPVEWRGDEATFQTEIARLPALAKLAQDLDCTRMITHVMPEGPLPVAEYAATSTRRLAQAAGVLADNGVRLGLEFLGPKQFRSNPDNVWFYDIAGALQAVDEIGRQAQLDNVGLLVDCWHWYASGGSVMDLASIPIELVVHVHINDAPRVPRDDLVDNVRLLPGASGVIDIVGFLQTLTALGYDGPLAVETFSAALAALPVDEAAARAASAVQQVMQAAGVSPVKLL